jgi:hypothetical protein
MLGHKISLNNLKKNLFKPYDLNVETDSKSLSGKFSNVWRLNNMLLNKNGSASKLKRKLKNLEINKDGNTIYQNLDGATKAILRWEFIVINVFVEKEAKSLTT